MKSLPLRFGWVLGLLLLSQSSGAELSETTFSKPPQQYGPYVWWHWMNGDVNPQETLNDLQWLADSGVAGVQVFEAGIGAPAPVQRSLVFGSPAWKQAMQASATKAKALGMEFAITTAPGWSATGGPWVLPQDAMKKLVWSETRVSGGQTVSLRLPAPPAVAGPFQDIPFAALGHLSHPLKDVYQDVAVFALPVSDSALPAATITVEGRKADALLQDTAFWPAQSFTTDENGAVSVDVRFDQPVKVQGVTLGLPGNRGFGSPNPPVAVWQVQRDDGSYHDLATLPATRSLTRTAAFDVVNATHFRLVLQRDPNPGFIDTLSYAQGAAKLPFPSHSSAYAISEIQLHTAGVVNGFEEKSGVAAAPDYYALSRASDTRGIAPTSVIDLTGLTDQQGQLTWQAPAGNWKIVRLGYSLTGHENGPAPTEATGLEADKLSAGAVKRHMQAYLQNYRDDNGELFDGITGLLSDSIESGPQNFTPDLLATFAQRFGYNPTPYLPALTGTLVGSQAQSDGFLWDFRTLLSELVTQQHYATLASVAHENQLTYFAEALEDHRPQLGNDLDMRAQADVPMAAFWHYAPGKEPKPTYLMDVKGAASVASLYGKPVVAGEAMTTFGFPWAVGPKELKPIADRAFVSGLNRLMLHSSVHQPDGVTYTPGKSMMPLLGHYFNRNVTWATMASPWIRYLARTQYVLQQGKPAATFAYFIGEEAPVTGLFGDKLPDGIPSGYDYDFVSAHGLDTLHTQHGKLFSQGGATYDFIYLGGSSRFMTAAILNKLGSLIKQGARVVGAPPVASPSLADSDIRQEVARLWSYNNVLAVSLDEAINAMHLAPQWKLPAEYQHTVMIRQLNTPSSRVFYVVNTSDSRLEVPFTIPAASAQSLSRWQPIDGNTRPVAVSVAKGLLTTRLVLAPHDAFFLVTGEKRQDSVVTSSQPGCKDVPVDSPWTLTFDPHYAQIAPVSMATLQPLQSAEDERVRGYSGTAVYSTTFTLPSMCASSAQLAVNNVADIGEVFINGVSAGHVWTPPYQLDISGLLKMGVNRIDVHISSLWASNLMSSEARIPGLYTDEAVFRATGVTGPMLIKWQ